MEPPNRLRVFVDANVLIRGITFPRYPYEILRLAAQHKIILVISPSVLADARYYLTTLFPDHLSKLDGGARGLVRWLRPEYQAPQQSAVRAAAPVEVAAEEADGGETPRPWPAGLAEQAAAVRAALVALGRPVSAVEVAAAFDGAAVARVAEWLAALAALGQARAQPDGRYTTA